ncbi:MAG: F0F1 ATP synthase subunit epsilon [Candidatus Zixiibacteriota bacterium]|nr:MAG: F0F1 ATP synthase subunit epsilon [candidate division Zixibacteria bacterium]
MAKTFRLDIVTPQGAAFTAEVEHLRAPGTQGSFGVLPGHTPFMTSLAVGEVDITVDGRVRPMAISGGFIEVLPDHSVILAQTAEFAEDIDVQRAEEALHRAEDRIKAHAADLDETRARAALNRSVNRLHVAGKKG